MPKGSCFCGNVAYQYTGEPQAQALCHCRDCQKIGGSTFSTNIVIPEDGFQITKGSPKAFRKTADSGKPIASYFCGDCGSTMYRDGDAFPGSKIIKAGTLDDAGALESAKPGVELFSGARPSWVGAIGGAGQKTGMPDSGDA